MKEYSIRTMLVKPIVRDRIQLDPVDPEIIERPGNDRHPASSKWIPPLFKKTFRQIEGRDEAPRIYSLQDHSVRKLLTGFTLADVFCGRHPAHYYGMFVEIDAKRDLINSTYQCLLKSFQFGFILVIN
jgi:hypothetical protein